MTNYNQILKPLFVSVWAVQLLNKGSKEEAFLLLQNLISNYPEYLKRLEVTNSLYLFAVNLADEDICASLQVM